jgi:hypothetical protein
MEGKAMSKRAPFRNEVKTRLDDRTYEALLRYQAIHGGESVSAVAARVLGTALLGVIGILPAEISGVSDEPSHIGTRQ